MQISVIANADILYRPPNIAPPEITSVKSVKSVGIKINSRRVDCPTDCTDDTDDVRL